MENKKAFPIVVPASEKFTFADDGMDLRDYFAAKAMQGLMIRFAEPGYTDAQMAVEAYSIADAMIKAREKK